MTVSPKVREAVRAVYHQQCGYCGVSETWTGSELEIDHFHPVAHGGTDDLSNLVYACPACNRFKGDYWPAEGAPADFRLLHPGQDDLEAHLVETFNGRLVGLTPTQATLRRCTAQTPCIATRKSAALAIDKVILRANRF